LKKVIENEMKRDLKEKRERNNKNVV